MSVFENSGAVCMEPEEKLEIDALITLLESQGLELRDFYGVD